VDHTKARSAVVTTLSAPPAPPRAAPAPARDRGRAGSLRATLLLVIGALLAILVITTGATTWTRLTVSAAESDLRNTSLPARQATSDLTTAYLEQESGQRGYLLTGDASFLEPYETGSRAAGKLQELLGRLLSDDPAALESLALVEEAGRTWRTGAAEPAISARERGEIALDDLAEVGRVGQRRFATLRVQLDALQDLTNRGADAQLTVISQVQALANVVAGSCVVLAALVAVEAVVRVRRRLARPVDQLLTKVQRVAAGDYDTPIALHGPRELTTIADSVEKMRASVLMHSRELVTVERELTLREEHDRLASDLHDLTIQRIFALGLGLTSVSRRMPDAAAALAPLVNETDRINRELRTVIFNLGRTEGAASFRGSVIDLAEESIRALGFTPTLEFAGPVDTVATEAVVTELLAVLRETLSNVARHAHATQTSISVTAATGVMTLMVTDDGVGIPEGPSRGNGLRNLRSRAVRLGGQASVRPGPAGGTVVEWCVPLRPAGA
jgi:signal transduction histidine kinase